MSHFIGSSVDTRITGENAAYATARNTATYHTDAGNLRVGQAQASGGTPYYVYRSYLYFDTSSIPGGDTVTDATIGVKVAVDKSTVDFNLRVYVYDWKPVTTGTRDDVFDLGAAGSLSGTPATLCAASSGTSGKSAGTWHTFALTGGELAGVVKGGISRFAMRSQEDIDNSAPYISNEYQEFYEGSVSDPNSPYLEVTHRSETGYRLTKLYMQGILTGPFTPF